VNDDFLFFEAIGLNNEHTVFGFTRFTAHEFHIIHPIYYIKHQFQLKFLGYISKRHLPRVITLGTDGIVTGEPKVALQLMGVKVHSVFDSKGGDRSHVDMYIAHIPCHPFSVPGCMGYSIKGSVFGNRVLTIQRVRPKCFILDSTTALLGHDNGITMSVIMKTLSRKLGDKYYISKRVYNSLTYGSPQNREGVYIVGLHKEYFSSDYPTPGALPIVFSAEDIAVKMKPSKRMFPCLPERKPDEHREILRMQGYPDSFKPEAGVNYWMGKQRI